jgi:hypothetical protein
MAKCAFKGCERSAVDDRLFCSEHLDSYDVSGVASYRGSRDSVSKKDRKDSEDDEDRNRG